MTRSLRERSHTSENGAIWFLLHATIVLPAILFICNFTLSNAGITKVGFGFLTKVTEQTAFVDRANMYLLLSLMMLPLQGGLILWLVKRTNISRFEPVIEMLRENSPLIKFGSIVLARKRLGFGAGSVIGFSLVFTSMFFVGGDLFLCRGCETASPGFFLMINCLGAFSLMVLMVVFVGWLRLLPQAWR